MIMKRYYKTLHFALFREVDVLDPSGNYKYIFNDQLSDAEVIYSLKSKYAENKCPYFQKAILKRYKIGLLV